MLNLDRSTWRRVKFGEVVTNMNETVKDPADAGIERVLGLDNLDGGDLEIRRWGNIADGTTFTRRVRPGQTLFGKRRAYQRKTAYATFDAICSGDILVFQPADTNVLLPELLPFLAMTEEFYDHALGTSAGSLSPRTKWSDLAKFEFDLPPLDQQRRIADLLWAVERHVRALCLVEDETTDARQVLRDEKFACLSSETVKFHTLTVIASQNGLSKPKATRAGDVPMVNIGELFRDEVLRPADFETVALTERESESHTLQRGDLLFARRSIVFEGAGLACLVPDMDTPHTFESSVIRVRPDTDLVTPEFLLHFFRSERGRRAISAIVRRGPVSGIAGSDLRELDLPIVGLSVQRKVAESIDAVNVATSAIGTELRQARQLHTELINCWGATHAIQ